MSAGSFSDTKYQASYTATEIHPIRIQPETALAVLDSVTNSAPTAALTSPISAKVSGSRRTIGLTPRKVTLEFTGEAPAGYDTGSQVTIPCLTQAFYNKALSKGTVGTYLDKAVKVVSSTPEYVK